nr:MAG TPA: hypothetical protein [Caudoviricetes sp.]
MRVKEDSLSFFTQYFLLSRLQYYLNRKSKKY